MGLGSHKPTPVKIEIRSSNECDLKKYVGSQDKGRAKTKVGRPKHKTRLKGQ